MELYQVKEEKLTRINGSDFRLERQLQNLIENNIETVLGVDFIASEFTVGNYRLDTVAFDNETNAFVIIEYKRSSKDSVIDQGYTYLNTMLNHKADFALEFNQHNNDQRRVEDFDWRQVRIVFIAGSYTDYQEEAVNNPNLPIDLYEAKIYSNAYMTLNKIAKSNNFAHHATVVKETKSRAMKSTTITNVDEIVAPSEESWLEGSSEEVQDLYQQIKTAVLAWDSNIEIKPTGAYIGFRLNQHNVTDILPQKKQLKVWINLAKGELNDPEKIFRDVSHIGHWGNGAYELAMKNDDQMEYILSLIKQSWKKNQQRYH